MQGASGAAQAVVSKSMQDTATLAAAHELAKVVMSKTAAMKLGALVSGRRLLDVSLSCLCSYLSHGPTTAFGMDGHHGTNLDSDSLVPITKLLTGGFGIQYFLSSI